MALSLCTKLCYGVGHVLNDLCASIWFTYFLLYFHNVILFGNKMAGALMLLGQITDGISTPLVGLESDQTKGFRNYGRRKTWHLVGTVLVVFSFPFVFNTIPYSNNAVDWARAIYYAPFVVMFQIGWASTQISHLALIPDLTLNEGERVLLNSIRYFFTVFSNLLVYGITFLLLHVVSDNSDPIHPMTPPPGPAPMQNTTDNFGGLSEKDVPTFRYLALIVVGIGLFFSILFHVGVKEKQEKCNENFEDSDYESNQVSTPCPNTLERPANILQSDPPCQQNIHRRTNMLQNDPPCQQNIQRRTNMLQNDPPCQQNIQRRTNMLQNDPPCQQNIQSSDVEPCDQLDNSQNNSLVEDTEVSGPSLSLLGGRSRPSQLMTWKEWLKEPQFYLVNLLYMGTRLIVNVSQVYISLYLTDSLNLHKNTIALIPLTINASGLVASIMQKQLQYFLGRKITFFIGLSFIIGFCVSVYLTDVPVNMWQIYLSGVLLGFGCSGLLIGVLSITSDLIGNNNESSAFVYGAMSFSDKLSNGIAVMVIQALHPCETCCVNCQWFYKYIEVFLIGSFCIFTTICMVVLLPMKIGQRWRQPKQVLITPVIDYGTI